MQDFKKSFSVKRPFKMKYEVMVERGEAEDRQKVIPLLDFGAPGITITCHSSVPFSPSH